MPIEIHQFPCLSDNYGFLLHDPASGETVCIDTPDAEDYLEQAALKGWRITQIWNTHWHPDHAGGNAAIKSATGCTITAPAGDAAKIAGIDRTVSQGDSVTLGGYTGHVLDVGGHTLGHVAYHMPEGDMVFVGDSLFTLGCGRMFEGTPPQFWASLSRLKALPAVPTMGEAGLKDFVVEQWQAVFAPAKTPAAIVQRLNREIAATLKDPALIALADKLGVTLVGGTPQQLGDLQKADSAKWAKVIKEGGIKAD
jgi:hypothetical protein